MSVIYVMILTFSFHLFFFEVNSSVTLITILTYSYWENNASLTFGPDKQPASGRNFYLYHYSVFSDLDQNYKPLLRSTNDVKYFINFDLRISLFKSNFWLFSNSYPCDLCSVLNSSFMIKRMLDSWILQASWGQNVDILF